MAYIIVEKKDLNRISNVGEEYFSVSTTSRLFLFLIFLKKLYQLLHLFILDQLTGHVFRRKNFLKNFYNHIKCFFLGQQLGLQMAGVHLTNVALAPIGESWAHMLRQMRGLFIFLIFSR
jgi:hypothetical protein